jgi:hypothetical protein
MVLLLGTEMFPETSVIFNELTRLIPRENLFNISRREALHHPFPNLCSLLSHAG